MLDALLTLLGLGGVVLAGCAAFLAWLLHPTDGHDLPLPDPAEPDEPGLRHGLFSPARRRRPPVSGAGAVLRGYERPAEITGDQAAILPPPRPVEGVNEGD